MTATTTEADLHAAIAAGDHAAYAPLADLYLEAGDERRARAVRWLEPNHWWPLACPMETDIRPLPVLYILGRPALGGRPREDDKWGRGRLGDVAVLDGLFQIVRDNHDVFGERWVGNEGVHRLFGSVIAGAEAPFRSSAWAYFGSVAQALEHLARALDPP